MSCWWNIGRFVAIESNLYEVIIGVNRSFVALKVATTTESISVTIVSILVDHAPAASVRLSSDVGPFAAIEPTIRPSQEVAHLGEKIERCWKSIIVGGSQIVPGW